MTPETPRKFYLEELRNKYAEKQESVKSLDIQQETRETQKEVEKVIGKIKTTLGQINITLLQL
jgi:trehalose-6-phosphate synthase